jgi:hypothetical protein
MMRRPAVAYSCISRHDGPLLTGSYRLDEFNSWMSFVGDPMGQWSMFYDLGPPKEAVQNFTNLQFSFVCLDTDDGLAALRIAQQTLRLVNIDLKEGEATSVSEECGQCQNSERPAIADIISTIIVETPEREDTLRELKAELGTLPCSNREALVRHQKALGDYYFTLESTRDALQQVAEALSGNPSERRPISYSVWRLKQLMRSVDLKRLTGEEETAYRDELSRFVVQQLTSTVVLWPA